MQDDLLIEQADNEIQEIDMPEELDEQDGNKKSSGVTSKEKKIEEALIEVTS